jgi:N-acetylmuramoyl-L-alanine amidase
MTRTHSLLSRADLIRRAAGAVVGVAAGRLLGGPALAAAVGPFPTPTIVVRDVPPGGRGPASASSRFNLIGLHWRGQGRVWFRTRSDDGWSTWQEALVHERADGDEARDEGWLLGTPVFTGLASAVEVRTKGPVERVRIHEIWSPTGTTRRRPTIAPTPFLIDRAVWGADESIVRADPIYADRLRFAVVHHTAGKSPSSLEESAAIVRGVQRYHVISNGWNDIGYNFVVDGFGQVFEGRGGGVDRNVIGAHALGFNTGSVGVAVLGNFERGVPTFEAQNALAQLLAWRLDVGHVDPLALVAAASTSGESRTLRAVSGHRDVGSTACPGATLYPLLDGLAQQIAATGLPKLYDPSVEVAGRLVRFTARFSQDVAFTVSVLGTDGLPAAGTSGIGAALDWTWDATAVADGRYAWSIDAGADVLPANGTITLGTAAAPAPEAPAPPKPPRPRGLPRRVPAWAWRLRVWHRAPKATRGPRPRAAPRRPPRWYWTWLDWVNAVERWNRDYGNSVGP